MCGSILSFFNYVQHNRSAKSERSTPSGNYCDIQLLYLVACLGLEGVDALRLSQNLVPEAFCNLRSQYICRIVNHVVGSAVMNSSNYDHVIKQTQCSNFFLRNVSSSGYRQELQELSALTGKAHTSFVSPPVTTCIQQHCNSFNVKGNNNN